VNQTHGAWRLAGSAHQLAPRSIAETHQAEDATEVMTANGGNADSFTTRFT
jgi:hypothetical protein